MSSNVPKKKKPVHNWQNCHAGVYKCYTCGITRQRQYLMNYWIYFKDGKALHSNPPCIHGKITNNDPDEKA